MNTELNNYTTEQLQDAVKYTYDIKLAVFKTFLNAQDWPLVAAYAKELAELDDALDDVTAFDAYDSVTGCVKRLQRHIKEGEKDIPESWKVLDEKAQVHHDIENFMHRTGLFKLPNSQEIFQALLAVHHSGIDRLHFTASTLRQSFMWSNTPQGHKYWGDIDKALDSL